MPGTCIRIFGSKKDSEKHVPDTHISHFSSSESNAITSKKREEYQTEQFESTLLKRMTKEEKTRKRSRVHTGNHQACIDDVRNIWEIFEPQVNRPSFPIFLAEQVMTEDDEFFARINKRQHFDESRNK